MASWFMVCAVGLDPGATYNAAIVAAVKPIAGSNVASLSSVVTKVGRREPRKGSQIDTHLLVRSGITATEQ